MFIRSPLRNAHTPASSFRSFSRLMRLMRLMPCHTGAHRLHLSSACPLSYVTQGLLCFISRLMVGGLDALSHRGSSASSLVYCHVTTSGAIVLSCYKEIEYIFYEVFFTSFPCCVAKRRQASPSVAKPATPQVPFPTHFPTQNRRRTSPAYDVSVLLIL